MTVENKYEKYLLRGSLGKAPYTQVANPIISMVNVQKWEDSQLCFRMSTITQPFTMASESHSHDYNAYMCFFGANPLNFLEFDAEIELCLGDEKEKQIITEPTSVFVPRGLTHCPLTFKRVGKPVLFLHIFASEDYAKK
jgi:hypothetical protein